VCDLNVDDVQCFAQINAVPRDFTGGVVLSLHQVPLSAKEGDFCAGSGSMGALGG